MPAAWLSGFLHHDCRAEQRREYRPHRVDPSVQRKTVRSCNHATCRHRGRRRSPRSPLPPESPSRSAHQMRRAVPNVCARLSSPQFLLVRSADYPDECLRHAKTEKTSWQTYRLCCTSGWRLRHHRGQYSIEGILLQGDTTRMNVRQEIRNILSAPVARSAA